MSTGKRIERLRGRTRLAEVARKARPGEREYELAELRHQREVQKVRSSFKTEDRTERRNRRWAALGRIMTAIGDGILALVAWLSGRWLALRGWLADRVVAIPVLVAGGSALYGQYNYLTDPTTPQFEGDRTGMGWHPVVSLFAGLAIEAMAFVLFRAAKRGRDAGDDVRLETGVGWSIVTGAVGFNSWHVDPLAGFLSAIGPIAWEVRERRERRNREIVNGTRGKAPIPMPRLSARFRFHYRQQYTAMLRIALWERARLSYPNLVARVENQTAAAELTASVQALTNLVSSNPVALTTAPGSANVSSHDALALEPGSADPGRATALPATPEPGSIAAPGSGSHGATNATEPGSAEPGSATRFTAVTAAVPDQVPVQVVETTLADTDLITAYPVWETQQVSNGLVADEPGCEPGSVSRAAEPGSTEPGSVIAADDTTEPGSTPAAAEPGSASAPTPAGPGSAVTAANEDHTEPGFASGAEPGSPEPAPALDGTVSSNPVPENELEQTRPMPRLVGAEPGSAEPGSSNPVRHLRALPADAEDAEAVKELVDLCVQLLDREGRWVSREDQLAHLREQGKVVPNRLRDAWWAQMREYRALVKAAQTG